MQKAINYKKSLPEARAEAVLLVEAAEAFECTGRFLLCCIGLKANMTPLRHNEGDMLALRRAEEC